MTMTRPPSTSPRTATLDRQVAMRLAATEYDRLVELLRSLSPDDWAAPTDCPGWDVHAIACHVLGMTEMTASLREQFRQNRKAGSRAKSEGTSLLDALTALQVAERSDLAPAQVVGRFATVGPRAARARRRTPGFIRRRRIPVLQDVGDHQEAWTFGFVTDVVLTRDPWMHRIDIARATGASLHLTADHDGVIVADVVAEWADRHGQAFMLRLSGPAGGEWTSGTGGPQIEMDAIGFCAVLSGRGTADGLLSTSVPF